jgi:hypothetical protein
MEENDLKDGEFYWSVAHSMETMNYNDGGTPLAPRRPWRGKLRIEQRAGGVAFLLCTVRSDTGEIDEDSNAIACVSSGDLYPDEEAAGHRFIEDSRRYVNSLTDKISECFGEMTDWHKGYRDRQAELQLQAAKQQQQEAVEAFKARQPMEADGLFDSDAETYIGD